MLALRPVLGMLALLTALGCQPASDQREPQPGQQGQPNAEQPAPPDAQGEPPAAGTVLQPTEQIRGDWDLELSATQQRQRELLELAFRDPPPSEQELEALELNPEEQLMLGMVLMGREQHPDRGADPKVLQGLEELSNAGLTVGEDSLVFTHGDQRREASYSIVGEESSSVVAETTTMRGGEPVVETVEILLEGADHLILRIQGDPSGVEQRFVRRASEEETEDPEQPKAQPAAKAEEPEPGAPPPQNPAPEVKP
jgi:hypothetical protein